MENILAPATLRQIPDSENFRRKDDWLPGTEKVRSVFAIRADKDAPRYEKVTVFNFEGVSPEQLMLLSCTNGVVVWVQRMLRDLGPEGMLNPSAFAEVNVLKDIIEGDRVPVDPKVRAERALARLSPAEREAILAKWLESDS